MEINTEVLPGVIGLTLKVVSAALALVSAICWTASARVELPRANPQFDFVMTGDGEVIDIAKAHRDQALWNRRAAYAAAGSAFAVVMLAILDAHVNGYTV